jgi:hypothetical protein
MSSFINSKSKPKEDNTVHSGFDLSHAKDILSVVATVSKTAQIPYLEAIVEIAMKIIGIVEACVFCCLFDIFANFQVEHEKKQEGMHEHCPKHCRTFGWN